MSKFATVQTASGPRLIKVISETADRVLGVRCRRINGSVIRREVPGSDQVELEYVSVSPSAVLATYTA